MAAGRLEAEMILFFSRATLGQLIKIGENKNLFDNNLTVALEQICRQRNYLTHNIYALFVELIDETILERNNLLDTDVLTYMDRAWQLRENLVGLADIISKKKGFQVK